MPKLLKLIENRLLFWLVAFLLVFIPLYPKFPLWGVSGTYVSIRLEDVFVALSLVVLGFWLLFSGNLKKLTNRNFIWFFLFWLAGLISTLSAILITNNVVPHIAFLHYFRRIEYMSLAFLAYFAIRSKKQIKWLVVALVFSTLGVIVYGIGQKYFGWPVVSTMNAEFSKGLVLKLTWWARINSTFAGHYDLAAYMVLVFPVFLATAIVSQKWYSKTIAAVACIFCYYMIILTASRISFPGYLIGGAVVLWISQRRWWLIPFITISILGMVVAGDLGQRYAATFKVNLAFLSGTVKVSPPASSVGIALPTATPTPKGFVPTKTVLSPTPTPTEIPIATESAEIDYSLEGTALATSRSTDIRLKVEWPRAIRAFLKNPLLGTGYSSITLATDNDYLRILGETGLIGALAFYGLLLELYTLFIYSWKHSRDNFTRMVILTIIASSVGYFINAGFIDVWEASKLAFFFWIMVGLGVRLIELDKNSRQ